MKFLYTMGIAYYYPGVVYGPFTAIEEVPYSGPPPSCPTGNLAVMTREAFGYVAAHAIGHMFELPDLRGPAARGPNGPNLMCSNDAICDDSAKVGTYLTDKQVKDAEKGLEQWRKKP